jgi:TP901 family phage tail tape measure protein
MAMSAGTAYVTVLPEMSGFATGVGRGINRVGNQLTRSGRVLTRGITIPLAAAGAASIKMALDFETSIQRVGSLTEANRGQVQKWSDQILNLAPKLAVAPNDFAQALYFVASSGAKVSQVMPITTAAVKASAAGMGDAQTVAQILTSAVNAYGEKNLSAAAAADVLTEAIKVGKAEPAALATSLGRVIPLAQAMGVTFAEAAASVSTLTNTGLSAAEATTALRAVLTTLVKPATQTKEEYQKLGLSVSGLQKSIAQHGLNETLVQLKNKIGDNKDALGKLFPNVRALTGFLALTGKNAAQVARNVDLVTHSTGAANKAFKRAAESDAFKFRKALAGLQAQAITLGAVLLPFAVQLLNDLEGLVHAFDGLSASQQKWIGIGLLVAATIGPIVTLIGNITIIAGGAIRALALIGQGFFVLAGASSAAAAGEAAATSQMVLFEAATAPVIGALGLVATGLAVITGIAFFGYMALQTTAANSFASAEREAANATHDLQSAMSDLKTGNLDLRQANLDRAKTAQQLTKDEKAQAAFVRKNGHESHTLAQQIEQDGINLSSSEVRQAQARARVKDAQDRQRDSLRHLLKAQHDAGAVARRQALEYERRLNPALFASHDATSRLKQATLVNTEAAKRFVREEGNIIKKTITTSGAMGKGQKKAAEYALAAQHLAQRIHDVPIATQVKVELNKNLPYYIGLVRALKDEIFKLPTNKTTRIHVITERALGGKAAGGPVAANTPYLVGEKGPELYVPRVSGNIIPNHRLGGGGGRTRANIYIEDGPTLSALIEYIADGSVGRHSNLNRQKQRQNR